MKNLPSWRIDNFVPLIGLVVALVLNVGTIFWWSGRVSLQLDQVIENQEELSQEFKEWKKQAETRIGHNEITVARLKDKVGL